MSNRIGKRGESIFATIISRNISARGFLLDPTFLGDKFPAVDFHVGLLDYPLKGFFYASVKTTTRGYYQNEGRIRIAIDKDEIAELGRFTVPVYIFGIDEILEMGYLISGNNLDNSKALNGLSTRYPVDSGNIELLWKEVAEYWDNSNKMTKFISVFN